MPSKFDKLDPSKSFDGWDATAGYQMVPVGDTRPMGVIVDALPGSIGVADSTVVMMKDVVLVTAKDSLKGTAMSQPALEMNSYELPAGQRYAFTLVAEGRDDGGDPGRSPGRTAATPPSP